MHTTHTTHLIALHQQRGIKTVPLDVRLWHSVYQRQRGCLRERLRHHYGCRADGSSQPGGALDNVVSTADRRGSTPIWSSFIKVYQGKWSRPVRFNVCAQALW
jgi:hypothetical protein